ncbi:MAG: sugar transferase [FCB group bacterium]|nr:sugar transferase [FCB group bacterium]
MKRSFDFVVALLGLLILSPLLLIISLATLATMGSPIFFRQIRVGRGGVDFKIIKFRSMIRDRAGMAITTGKDTRITPFGRFLRRTKLDELPQLFNVVSGDMSLVGPRPEVPQFVRLYTETQRRVLAVRPGLTDPASIVYRDEESVLARYGDPERAYIEKIMPAKLKMNLAYLEKAGFWTDFGLILKTLKRLSLNR